MKRKPPSKNDLVRVINEMDKLASVIYHELINDCPHSETDRHENSRPAFERLQELALEARSYFPAELPASRNGWNFTKDTPNL